MSKKKRVQMREIQSPEVIEKDERIDVSQLKGYFFKGHEVKKLKEAFPFRPRMWIVDEYYPASGIYVDRGIFSCDVHDQLEKKRILGDQYRILK